MSIVTRQRDAVRSQLFGTEPGEAEWMDQALCVGADPELFHPEGATGPQREHYRRQVDAAKAICGRCPVQAACLDYALTEGIPFGIYGGKTQDERRQRRNPIRVCEQCGKGYSGRGEKYCGPPCKNQAQSLRLSSYAMPRSNCGTRAGARLHRLHGETVDPACRMAETLYRAQLRAKRKERANA